MKDCSGCKFINITDNQTIDISSDKILSVMEQNNKDMTECGGGIGRRYTRETTCRQSPSQLGGMPQELSCRFKPCPHYYKNMGIVREMNETYIGIP